MATHLFHCNCIFYYFWYLSKMTSCNKVFHASIFYKETGMIERKSFKPNVAPIYFTSKEVCEKIKSWESKEANLDLTQRKKSSKEWWIFTYVEYIHEWFNRLRMRVKNQRLIIMLHETGNGLTEICRDVTSGLKKTLQEWVFLVINIFTVRLETKLLYGNRLYNVYIPGG